MGPAALRVCSTARATSPAFHGAGETQCLRHDMRGGGDLLALPSATERRPLQAITPRSSFLRFRSELRSLDLQYIQIQYEHSLHAFLIPTGAALSFGLHSSNDFLELFETADLVHVSDPSRM